MSSSVPTPVPSISIDGGWIPKEDPCKNKSVPIEPTWYCDEENNITGGVVFTLDCCGNLIPLYINPEGQIMPDPPTGNICGLNSDVEFQNTLICFEDAATGDVYNKEIRRVYQGTDLVTETLLWHYPDGSQSPDPPVGVTLVNCRDEDDSFIDVPLCDPTV